MFDMQISIRSMIPGEVPETGKTPALPRIHANRLEQSNPPLRDPRSTDHRIMSHEIPHGLLLSKRLKMKGILNSGDEIHELTHLDDRAIA